jgi:hypothetical protein
MDDADFEDGGDEAEYMEDGEAPEGVRVLEAFC